jgi:hypothetical protein
LQMKLCHRQVRDLALQLYLLEEEPPVDVLRQVKEMREQMQLP